MEVVVFEGVQILPRYSVPLRRVRIPRDLFSEFDALCSQFAAFCVRDLNLNLGAIERVQHLSEDATTEETKPGIAKGLISKRMRKEIKKLRREEVEQTFLNGKLIYRPTIDSDIGKIEFPIRELATPLEGIFTLPPYDAGQTIRIATGYRKKVSTVVV